MPPTGELTVSVIKPTFSLVTPALARAAATRGPTDLGLRLGGLAAPTTASLARELAEPTRTGHLSTEIDRLERVVRRSNGYPCTGAGRGDIGA